MKPAPWIPLLFAALCLAQWAVPAAMIHQRESALRHGEIFRFKTAPVDPYDAFRGRYVALDYEQNAVSGRWSEDDGFRKGRPVFALLDTDADGFAVIRDLSFAPPEEGSYLRVRLHHVYGSQARIRLPFDRFYLDEFSAPEAEREFRLANRGGERAPAHARVRVRRGFGVIEDLVIDGQSIRDWLETRRASP